MGLGWRVALERPIPDVEGLAVEGKALVFGQYQLNLLAERRGFPRLTDFLSANPEQLAAYLKSQGLNGTEFDIPVEEWFPASEGLVAVRGLLNGLSEEPRAVTNVQRVMADLRSIEGILAAAEREQVRFHLQSTLPG